MAFRKCRFNEPPLKSTHFTSLGDGGGASRLFLQCGKSVLLPWRCAFIHHIFLSSETLLCSPNLLNISKTNRFHCEYFHTGILIQILFVKFAFILKATIDSFGGFDNNFFSIFRKYTKPSESTIKPTENCFE